MVTYYDRKTLPAHKLIPQPKNLTICDYTMDEDYGIGCASGETLSLLAGGIETLRVPVFSQREIKRMLRWGHCYHNNCWSLSSEDKVLSDRLKALIDEGEN